MNANGILGATQHKLATEHYSEITAMFRRGYKAAKRRNRYKEFEMFVMARRYAGDLRQELGLRNRLWARGREHVESYGNSPVIVYAPEHFTDEDLQVVTPPEHLTNKDLALDPVIAAGRHGNFFDAAYTAIVGKPDWMRRFDKIHAQGKSLPKAGSGRRWRELDSSMSSDALLMNIFCTPGVAASAAVRGVLGVDREATPVFGWRARVQLALGRFDRTEVDMRWGSLLVEAKLTEGDFQTRASTIVEGYRDFDAVFERELLPRVELRAARRRTATEFAEEFTQEWEDVSEDGDAAREYQAGIVARATEAESAVAGYEGYQLIRNVLAAYAEECSFCVLHDARRPDLRERWFQVMAAVKHAEMRVRCKVLTWQELAPLLPAELQEFLDLKYGIVGPGRAASSVEGWFKI
jgi:hypothetical protein